MKPTGVLTVLALLAVGNASRGFVLPKRDLGEVKANVARRFEASNTTVDVTTPFGSLRGYITESGMSQHFLGIPFAQPPVGSLRWQPPTGPMNWTGVRNASWFGPACPQSFGAMTIGTEISEDCLYLNVYRPNKTPPPGGFPVMVFIYGGSWKEGSGSFFLYWADNDIKMVEDVVLVTINYRLSAFGFLASETLRAQDPDGTTGNYGFQDQRAALKWVIKAAPSFGGNPTNIMLFGESAGAGSTSCHLVAPRSAGLFQRAAMESGPFSPWAAMPYNISELKYGRVAAYLGCTSAFDEKDPVAIRRISTDDAVLTCLRSKNMSDILSAGDHSTEGDARVDWAPTVDGVELTDLPENLAAAGKIYDVPTLLGSNYDEGTEFSQAPKDLNDTGYMPYLISTFGADLANAVAPYYPPANYTNAWWAETHIIGDGLLSCPSRRSARWMQHAPNRKNPVFLYFYVHVLEVVQLFVPDKGCFHGSELVMVYNFVPGLWTSGEQSLSDQFVRYWTRFATSGNPNGGTDPQWPAYDQAQDQLMVLDVGSGLAPQANTKKTVCDLWDTLPIDESLIFGH